MRITAIITNFQGRGLVTRCVASLLAEPPHPEIIVVDNASTDDSVAVLRQRFGRGVTLIALGKNYGPARAWNVGAKAAGGEILLFLDNDTEVQPGTLGALERLFTHDPSIGAAQCKLLFKADPKRIDYVGDYLSQFGFLIQRAPLGTVDHGQYDSAVEILSAKSAAMAVRREALEAASGFDESYFQYIIETDLCWRVWLAGYRVVFCPGTAVFHAWGGTERVFSDRYKRWNVKYQGTRNSMATLVKNVGSRALLSVLPRHLFLWLGYAGWLVIKRDLSGSFGILQGIGAVIRWLPRLWWTRRSIQRQRKISDRELFRRVLRRQPLTYFIRKISISPPSQTAS